MTYLLAQKVTVNRCVAEARVGYVKLADIISQLEGLNIQRKDLYDYIGSLKAKLEGHIDCIGEKGE